MRSPPVPFSRTLRAVEADGFIRSSIGIAVGGVLIAAWVGWLLVARVTLYETSRTARIEVAEAARPLEVQVDGRVTATRLELGRRVKLGEVLLQIDDRTLRLRLAEETARLEGLKPQLGPLHGELASAEQTIARDAASTREALAEVKADTRAAEAEAHFAEGAAGRYENLREGVESLERREQVAMQAKKLRSEVEAALHREKRIEGQRSKRETEQRARIERLRKEVLEIESAIETQEKTVERIQHELSECVLEAPADGLIADVIDLKLGASVSVGMRVATVIPDAPLRIVAEFVPDSAVGRIQVGQRARMRLETFPWLEHGLLGATVRSAATEPRNGTVRVELDIDPSGQPPSIHSQHGLIGTVEVAAEELSPARLLLRVIGRELTP